MFRVSLRSASDPLRGHVCIPYVARRSAPANLRQFYRTSTPLSQSSPQEHGSVDASTEAVSPPSDQSPLNSSTRSEPNLKLQQTKRVKEKRKVNREPATLPLSTTRPFSKLNQRQRKRFKELNPDFVPPQRDAAIAKAKREKAAIALGKTEDKGKHVLDWIPQPQADQVESQPDQATQPAESNDAPVTGSTQASPSKPARSNTLNLTSNSNVVKEILRAGRQGREINTAGQDEKNLAENQGKERETLTHIAKHVLSKDRGSLTSTALQLTALDYPMAPVPGVSFGLDRVLFNPGVYHLRDPRSRVYNFDPYLGDIMPVTEFDFNTLKPYVTSSKDTILCEMAQKNQRKYYGSSSSMTSALSHFHYLLSAWRSIDTRNVSQGFPEKLRSFTRLLRAPTAMFVHYKEKEDVYAIDADKEFDSANILMNLGKSMEKLLTLPKEQFERYRRSSANKITPEEEEAIPESYHYTTMGKFLMRSQLDAYDPRLPGTGMYDLKTRAVISIRMDASNHENGIGYELKGRFGTWESYEREYFDMMRAAFLKYSLQVRVGRMDGIFVAYHNIERIFGFQYVSLPEMDQCLHGQTDTTLGDSEFKISLALWEKIMDKATAKFPKQSLRFHFETREAVNPFMYIFAQPVTNEQIHAIQTRNSAEIETLQNKLLGLETLESRVQEPGENQTTPSAEAGSAETTGSTADEYDPNLLAMTLLTKNYVNGELVERPTGLSKKDTWTVEYEINELNPKQGNAILQMCKTRRRNVFEKGDEEDVNTQNDEFLQRLRNISEQGRVFRARENERDRRNGIVVYSDPISRD
ncbi:hypothetical protein PENARI_c014G10986 [Penicillium arizonense]|uniref:Uncharacterized protein n=1 Tax=Penicillium arizonense TaxID=1835702 RepID=A0A1F5LE19_PENAI|nr:hypothetical protein PENARI_c014G10986 [Penicillium arizonense]OGE51250.1 hypothetical protein PENARI_c014G10986 [Penicillium arizonense]